VVALDMRYLWQHRMALSNQKLESTLAAHGEVQHTALHKAMEDSLV
jgi:hypothetical protein